MADYYLTKEETAETVTYQTPDGTRLRFNKQDTGRLKGLVEYLYDLERRADVLPCKAGETWRDSRGEPVVVDGYYYDRWAGWTIQYHYTDGENGACNSLYFKAHFTREEKKED